MNDFASVKGNVPKGYKLTDIGVIPEDWVLSRLGDCGIVVMGQSPPGSSYNRVSKGSPLLNGPTEFTDRHPIKAQWTTQPARFCKEGDLLICVRGSSTGRTNYADETYAIGRGVAAIRAQGDNDTEYVSYRVVAAVSAILSAATGSTFPSVDGASFRRIAIPLPPAREQRAIAEALSDVDGLIEALEKLIAKKRAIKQAAMQQLLTGMTRLPRFTGEWEIKRLGDHVTFLSHGTNSRAELLPDGRVKYLHYGDVHAATLAVLEPSSLPSLPEQKATRLDRLRDGDLVFVDASEDLSGVSKSVEICGVRDTELVAGLHTITARFDKEVFADGFKAYLQFCPMFAGQLRRLAAGTKVYATNRSHIASVEMPLPGTVEQAAIASVFQDMDTEIAALEQHRDKTQKIKQGMMQPLLTGRVRLVENKLHSAGSQQ